MFVSRAYTLAYNTFLEKASECPFSALKLSYLKNIILFTVTAMLHSAAHAVLVKLSSIHHMSMLAVSQSDHSEKKEGYAY